MRGRPNTWVLQDTNSTTQLTYALQLDPAPVTVSIPGEDPVLASLEFVITNPTSSALPVQSVAFTITVGPGASLTPTTAGVVTAVSDTANWSVNGPPSTITSGTATYTLEPATGSDVSLAPGASVVVQIFQIQTNTTPGNTTILLKEMVASRPGFTNFLVTTFPSGFYFNGLAATVQSGSSLVPVAQVAAGSPVTLVWNSSVVDTAAFTVLYSSATKGQQSATPSLVGEWTSGSLTSDTVFTVKVEVSVEGGEPLTASMSTAVSVQNPSLVAASITAAQATVTGAASVGGPLTANAVSATGLTVNGQLSANSAQVSGALSASSITAGGANISGALNANSAGIRGAVQSDSLSAVTAAVTGAFRANQGTASLIAGMQHLTPGVGAGVWVSYQAYTDGFVIGYVGQPASHTDGCVAWASVYSNGIGVQTTGGNVGFFGPAWSYAMCSNPNMCLLPVQIGNQFSLNLQQNTAGQQSDAPYAFYWVPLGTAPAPRPLSEDELWDRPPALPTPGAGFVRQDDEPRKEFIALLEQVVGKPIDEETRDKLISVLRLL